MRKDTNKTYYFDSTASSAVPEIVAETYRANIIKYFANPAAAYQAANEAKQLIKDANKQFAAYFQVKEQQILFTSGATEAINTAFYNMGQRKNAADVLLLAAGEHSASIACAKRLTTEQGLNLEVLPLNESYQVDLDYLESILKVYQERVLALSLVYVSNETGAINNLSQINSLLRRYSKKALWHLDAVQAWGKVDCDLSELTVDFASFAGHKIGAPKGSGLLYIREPQLFKPLIVGGGQQANLRSGTENAPLVAALAQAMKLNCNLADLLKHQEHLWLLRKKLQTALQDLPIEYQEATEQAAQYPGIISLSLDGIRGEVLLHALERHGIMLATSSSCHNLGKPKNSDNMSIFTPKQELGHLRISLQAQMTIEDIEYLAAKIKLCYKELQR